MGVTIHFEGYAKSMSDINKILSIAKSFAVDNNMLYKDVSKESGILERLINEEEADYTGPVFGLNISPHESAEQLKIEFGDDLFMQDYCKTQFAPIEIHVAIIELFKKIEPYFSTINLFDEGEFWEKGDIELLNSNLLFIEREIDKKLSEDKNLYGPVRTEDRRIADLMRKG